MPDLDSDISYRITQTGAENVAKSFDDINSRLDKSAAANSNLTKFIREQRAENRTQNFVFRESTHAIGAVSYSLLNLTSLTGSASKSTQALTRTLSQGFNAYQGAGFAMTALGIASGGTTLAISALVAGGVALLSFLDKTNEKANRAADEGLKKFAERVGGLSLGGQMQSIEGLKNEIRIAEGVVKNLQKISLFGSGDQASGAALAMQSAQARVTTLKEELKIRSQILDEGRSDLTLTKQSANILKMRQAELAQLQARLENEKLTKREIYELTKQIYEKEKAIEDLKYKPPKEEEETEGPLPPGWRRKVQREGDREARNIQRKVEKDIAEAWKKSKSEVRELNFEEMRFLHLLDQGVGALRGAVGMLGVETDNFIGKLQSALRTIIAMLEVYEAFKAIGAFFGSSGSVSIPMGAITTPGPVKPLSRQALANAIHEAGRLGYL